jgi:hypothetical protein
MPETSSNPWGTINLPEEVSNKAFIVSICLLIGAGSTLSMGVAHLLGGYGAGSAPLLIAFATVGLSMIFGGVEVTTRTRDWRGSLLGHFVACFGIGALVAPLASLPGHPGTWSLGIVASGTLVIALVASVRPGMIAGWGAFLIAMAVTTACVQAVNLIPVYAGSVPGPGPHLVAAIFLAHLDHYLSRALALPRTPENIVDTACAVHVDGLDQLLRLADSRRAS